jgi:hypothetical protein
MTDIVAPAEWFVPPYPKALVPDYSGYSAAVGSSQGSGSTNSGGTSSQLPDTYDLEWVAGDTAEFQFYFDGVCWTDLAPTDTLGLPWVETLWEAQVRIKAYSYYGYWWPPTWPGYRYITSFVVTSEFLDDFNGLGPGTMVTLNGGTLWPGAFVWDLQTTQTSHPALVVTVRTWLSGKATVDPQVTQDDRYPPSHWSVLPYA